MLISDYTFDRFIIGQSNMMARAMAYGVADLVGDRCQIVYIYGDTGLGKTHLLHAIGNNILKYDASRSVVCVSAETFCEEFILALRAHDVQDFRAKYKSTDVLLIDNIQFFDGKDTIQDEVLCLFEALEHTGKLIVLTSSISPYEFSCVDNRLLSRLKSATILEILKPDFELRKKILLERTDQSLWEKHPELDDVLVLLATKIKDDIRGLEGALYHLTMMAEILNEPITVKFAKDVLKNVLKKK